ncbi:hypothetical protein K4H02_26390, partial [Mycobacterium tuberculosis]|nr:hypothetical protein [Mycobacterium tuberculosis]
AHLIIGISGVNHVVETEVVVSVLDLSEEDMEGLVQMGAIAPSGDVDKCEITETIEAVAGFVLRRSDGDDLQLRRRFGEEDE